MISDPLRPRREAGGLAVTSTAADGAIVVHPVGEVDMATEDILASGIDAALNDKPAVLILDLTGVGFFGSVGVSVLIRAQQRCDCELRMVVTPPIRRMLTIVGLQNAWQLFDRLDDALRMPSAKG
ncbi:STAS domain-containing protein [Actinokineospora sp. HUAS TT18]|uniref:STAS domain-containing protein n=1 Tax=Actinokineospora sp. HUAS TT18 TaxID=3447451 RepID=UPI003F51E9CC